MPLELNCPICGVINTVNPDVEKVECKFCHSEIVIGKHGLS